MNIINSILMRDRLIALMNPESKFGTYTNAFG